MLPSACRVEWARVSCRALTSYIKMSKTRVATGRGKVVRKSVRNQDDAYMDVWKLCERKWVFRSGSCSCVGRGRLVGTEREVLGLGASHLQGVFADLPWAAQIPPGSSFSYCVWGEAGKYWTFESMGLQAGPGKMGLTSTSGCQIVADHWGKGAGEGIRTLGFLCAHS